jgi:hypothetical protein
VELVRFKGAEVDLGLDWFRIFIQTNQVAINQNDIDAV